MKKMIIWGIMPILFFLLTPLVATASEVPLVIPVPHQEEATGKNIYLPEHVTIDMPEGLNTEAAELHKILAAFELTPSSPGAAFAFRLKLQSGLNAQGYKLEVGDHECMIRASAPAGFFYGLQTLKQLMRRNETGVFIPQVTINDQPALAMRGVYLGLNSVNVTPESMQRIKDLFYAMAELKINTLFLEFSNNVKYTRQHFPQSDPHAFSREQVKELVAYARELHMEVIPYLQTLSHCPWILANPDNVKLLEDPNERGFYAGWCPNNPETKKFIKDIIEETVELIKPRYFHIAVDEVAWCSFRKCPKCAGMAPSEVLKKHIMDMYSLLKAQGVKTIMWHDQLIEDPSGYNAATQGWKIVDSLPRDIIIDDWCYRGKRDELNSELDFFTKKGFEVIGSAFYHADGTKLLAECLSSHPKAVGVMMTYWYLASEWGTPTIAPHTMSSTTALAMYGWNPEKPAFDQVNFDTVAFLASRWFKTLRLGEVSRNIALALPFNRRLGFRSNDWPGVTAAGEMQPLPEQLESRFGTFNLGPAAGDNVVAVSGAEDDGRPRAPINIPVYLKAENLSFLQACDIPQNNDQLNYMTGPVSHPLIGLYVIVYNDKTTEEIHLRYRDLITSWNDQLSPLRAETIFTGKSSNGTRIVFSAFQWRNPHPEKLITSIIMRTMSYQRTSFALLGVNARLPPLYNQLCEGFNYGSPAEFLKRWVPVVNPGNLANNASYALTPAIPGKQESLLTITVPKVGERNFLKFDAAFKPEAVLADKCITFNVSANQKCKFAVYLGDKDYSNYRVGYGNVNTSGKPVQIRFSFDGMLKEGGKLSFDQVTQIRLAVYLNASDKPVVVKISPLRWTDSRSDVRLNNGNWFDSTLE
mgnify:CR=1 FL=1